MIETIKYMKGFNKVEEGNILQRKRHNRTRGHALKVGSEEI